MGSDPIFQLAVMVHGSYGPVVSLGLRSLPAMARQRRQAGETGVYHVMNRGSRRWPTFQDDGDRQAFLSILSRAAERVEISVLVYCLMGNHYHFLLRTGESRALSEFMRYLGAHYTQFFNAQRAIDGPLFRCLLYTSPSPRDATLSRMPSSA